MPEPTSSGTVTEVVTCSSAILSVSTTGVNPRSCEMVRHVQNGWHMEIITAIERCPEVEFGVNE